MVASLSQDEIESGRDGGTHAGPSSSHRYATTAASMKAKPARRAR